MTNLNWINGIPRFKRSAIRPRIDAVAEVKALSVGGLDTAASIRIDLGPTHPASAGLLRGTLTLSGDVVVALDPQPGALHRGAEMIFAARDLRQALTLANRHDWQAPFFGEWVLARCVEDALGLHVPPRAAWLRAALAEHHRIASHLAHLSFVGFHAGRSELGTGGVREVLRQCLAELTGNRVHPMAVRLGGVGFDPTPRWLAAERSGVRAASELARRLTDAAALGRGVAVVRQEHVDAFGLAGPVARASGVLTDLRRAAGEEPYTTTLDEAPPDAPTAGDAAARFAWLAAEVVESAALVERLLDNLPAGPLAAHLPKVVKLPEGDAVAAVEAPLGRAGVVITSRGEKTPWRLRLRTASAANVSAWPAVVPPVRLVDLPVALASLGWVAGDLDK